MVRKLILALVAMAAAGPVLSADMPKGPGLRSLPACKWTRVSPTVWSCAGTFKLTRPEGDPARLGYCGVELWGADVRLLSLSLEMANASENGNPFEIIDLYRTSQPGYANIGGTFRSATAQPRDLYCKFRTKLEVRRH